MLEFSGNIFHVNCDAICITTNGFTKSNGEAVMGKGCAKEAANLVPTLPALLGKHLRNKGNVVGILHTQNHVKLLNFPVKPITAICTTYCDNVVRHMQNKFRVGDSVPGWACVADIEIIRQSAQKLVEITDRWGWEKVVLPRPGCGAGELNWTEVKPVLDKILDDRFIAMTF